MFRKVMLLTNDHHYVATVLMPAFKRPPEIVIWGQRVFSYTLQNAKSDHSDIQAATDQRYCEIFSYVVPLGYNPETGEIGETKESVDPFK